MAPTPTPTPRGGGKATGRKRTQKSEVDDADGPKRKSSRLKNESSPSEQNDKSLDLSTSQEPMVAVEAGMVERPANAEPNGEIALLNTIPDPNDPNATGISLAGENPEKEGDEVIKATAAITNFQLYDENDRLVPPERILPSVNNRFFICGTAVNFLSQVDDIKREGSIEVSDVEVVDAVWIQGFGDVPRVTVGVSSEQFDIYLLQPHKSYQRLFEEYERKGYIAKTLADFLMERCETDVTFEDLSEFMEELSKKNFRAITMDDLFRHIEFVSSHLVDFDSAREPDEPSILSNTCVDYLKDMCPNAKFERKKGTSRRMRRKAKKTSEEKEPTTVLTTPTVSKIFDEYEKAPENMSSLVERLEKEAEAAVTSGKPVETVATSKKPPNEKTKSAEKPIVSLTVDSTLFVGKQVYQVGDGVLLDSRIFSFAYKRKEPTAVSEDEDEDEAEKYDEEKYPEKYRKYLKRKIEKTMMKPFCLGRIMGFDKKKDKAGTISVAVRVFYRPEDTSMKKTEACEKDMNLLYYSEETNNVSARDLQGNCAILPSSEIEKHMTLDEYFNGGENRFYYREMFQAKGRVFQKPPQSDDEKAAIARIDQILKETAYPVIKRRLKTMDLFSGCGGLSEGLHQAGLTETRWAVEIDSAAAEAFKLNNPAAEVFEADINVLLREVLEMNPKARLPNPDKVEVDFIVGGPPCQGFCGMNRFNDREASKLKNSLLISYLCAIEIYKPKFILMENVKNLKQAVSNKKTYFGRALECLRRMGYTVGEEILQAANYGVPQSRSRVIVIGAKEGYELPEFPSPINSFGSISGPMRSLNVRDAISDLIDSPLALESKYQTAPQSHYQRLLRKSSKKLIDHFTKPISDLNQQRINHIPKRPDADWRDLPNIELPEFNIVKLAYMHENGTKTKKVCPCQFPTPKSSKENCIRADGDALIPWCLPHTGDRHNHWAGLFGRLDYDGVFPTTVTALEMMGKQGRGIHPELDRLITVREAARSQGFPDHFKFYGEVLNKHRQIGNAVPPPLALAIGRKFLSVVAEMKD